ncbi:hypothetical protein [Pseudoroseomonas sp. WGS1072]|uniref:hypothetical protein n=1 Tax=Roseomonas sp. WGS1072 TaxID=3366816 RepID=UPI003BF131DA
MDRARQPRLRPDAVQPLDDGLDHEDLFWVSPDELIQSYRSLPTAALDEAMQEFERNLAALVAEIDADTSLD